jgi:hypothetical protein
MMTLEQQMAAIRHSRMTQFSGHTQIQPEMLVAGVERHIKLPGLASALWMPPSFVVAGQIIANPPTMVFGVRINLPSAPMLPWGLQGNNVSSFTGPVEELFVTLLSGTAALVTLLSARGIGIGYSNGLTAAGTPATSPSFGTGAGVGFSG